MLQIDMVPIDEPLPSTRAVVPAKPGHDGPLIGGHGPDTFRCGRCKRVLALNVERDQLQDVVIQCSMCSTLNEIPVFRNARL